MTKTYSTKSNASRAAAKVAGAVVERIETAAGYQFAVVLPVIGETVYTVPGDGVDGPGEDDVPMRLLNSDADVVGASLYNTAPSVALGAVLADAPGYSAANLVAPANARLKPRKAVAAPVGTQVGGPAPAAPKPTAKAVPAKAGRAPAATASKPAGSRAAAQLAAAQGRVPTAPDFSAPTHKAYRKKLAILVILVEAGDLAGVRAFQVNPTSTSPKALARYRDLAAAALEAQAK